MRRILPALAAAIGIMQAAACVTDSSTGSDGVLGVPLAHTILAPSGSHLRIWPEISGGATCTYSGWLGIDTVYFEFPIPTGTDSVRSIMGKSNQTNTNCSMVEAGWVWVVVTAGNTTEHRPRIDLWLNSEDYSDLPSPGTVELTAQANPHESKCSFVGWRLQGGTVVYSSTIEYSIDPGTQYVGQPIFNCGTGGPF